MMGKWWRMIRNRRIIRKRKIITRKNRRIMMMMRKKWLRQWQFLGERQGRPSLLNILDSRYYCKNHFKKFKQYFPVKIAVRIIFVQSNSATTLRQWRFKLCRSKRGQLIPVSQVQGTDIMFVMWLQQENQSAWSLHKGNCADTHSLCEVLVS